VADAPDKPGFNYDWLRGMAAYRCGRFQRAIDLIAPRAEKESSTHATSRAPILFSFLAMANHELGNVEQSRQHLERARAIAQETLPTPDGPEPAPNRDMPERPIRWCMFQIAIREAEELIESGETASKVEEATGRKD
jgi:hypothetical protein